MEPVHIAAMCGHVDSLKYLATFPGVDVNAKDHGVREVTSISRNVNFMIIVC